MIQSTVGHSVMKKVNSKAVTLLWLISLTHGRIIISSDLLKAEGSRDRDINEISDVQNRAWSHNPDRNVEARATRLSELEWSAYSVREPNGPGTFVFGYDNAVDSAGNEHYRTEERFENGTVVGEYGYTDYGINRIVRVSYTADHLGYRARTEFSPLEGLSSKNSISR